MHTLPDNPFQSVDVIARILKFARLRPLDQSQSRTLHATGPFNNPTLVTREHQTALSICWSHSLTSTASGLIRPDDRARSGIAGLPARTAAIEERRVIDTPGPNEVKLICNGRLGSV